MHDTKAKIEKPMEKIITTKYKRLVLSDVRNAHTHMHTMGKFTDSIAYCNKLSTIQLNYKCNHEIYTHTSHGYKIDWVLLKCALHFVRFDISFSPNDKLHLKA